MEKGAGKQKAQYGFTLLEVMIAIAILNFGILAVASMQIAAIKGNSIASRLTEGTSWAQDKMEELLSLPHTDPNLSNGSHGPETARSGINIYAVNWSVTEDVNAADPLTRAKLITVIVTWQEKGVGKSTLLHCIRPRFL